MNYTKILIGEVEGKIAEFSDDKLELYTKKNEFEFIKLTTMSDAVRYMYRLYTKD